MSQWSDAIANLKKTGDVPAFVTEVATDLAKDFQAFSALPGVKAFEDWLAKILISELGKINLTPTLAGLIAAAISDAL